MYTNVYITENKNDIKQWDVDNAVLWADALAFKLSQEGIPVLRDVISSGSKSNIESIQAFQ